MSLTRSWIGMLALGVSSLALGKWPAGTEPFATAKMEPKSGSKVTGTVDIGKSKEGLLVRAYLKGIAPGPHAIHVHDKGDCSSADASSAGEHFNPKSHPHAGPTAAERHVGDFGNLEVPAGKDRMVEIKIPH